MKLYRYSINATIVFLLLSGLIHALSFFVKDEASNDTEKQLIDLMHNYKADFGAGFFRSFHEIFLSLSACFTLLLLLGGSVLYYLNKKNISKQLMTGILNIYLFFYGILFIVVWSFTFLPPILCISLVFVSLIFSRWSIESLEEI